MTAAVCPFCGSTSVNAVSVSTAHLADAVVVAAIFGVAPGVAAGRGSEVVSACAACGRQWKPGVSDIDALRDAYGLNGAEGSERAAARAAGPPPPKTRVRAMVWLVAGAIVLAVVLLIAQA